MPSAVIIPFPAQNDWADAAQGMTAALNILKSSKRADLENQQLTLQNQALKTQGALAEMNLQLLQQYGPQNAALEQSKARADVRQANAAATTAEVGAQNAPMNAVLNQQMGKQQLTNAQNEGQFFADTMGTRKQGLELKNRETAAQVAMMASQNGLLKKQVKAADLEIKVKTQEFNDSLANAKNMPKVIEAYGNSLNLPPGLAKLLGGVKGKEAAGVFTMLTQGTLQKAQENAQIARQNAHIAEASWYEGLRMASSDPSNAALVGALRAGAEGDPAKMKMLGAIEQGGGNRMQRMGLEAFRNHDPLGMSVAYASIVGVPSRVRPEYDPVTGESKLTSDSMAFAVTAKAYFENLDKAVQSKTKAGDTDPLNSAIGTKPSATPAAGPAAPPPPPAGEEKLTGKRRNVYSRPQLEGFTTGVHVYNGGDVEMPEIETKADWTKIPPDRPFFWKPNNQVYVKSGK